MTRQVLYVAAPLRPTEDESAAAPKYNEGGRSLAPRSLLADRALRANPDRAMRWLAWLRRSFPETTFIAPWIATVLSLDGDDSPALREAGPVDDCAVVERCDGIVLCGGRISEGMRREMEYGIGLGPGEFLVADITPLGAEPPPPPLGRVRGCSFREWARSYFGAS